MKNEVSGWVDADVKAAAAGVILRGEGSLIRDEEMTAAAGILLTVVLERGWMCDTAAHFFDANKHVTDVEMMERSRWETGCSMGHAGKGCQRVSYNLRFSKSL
jgi:hypothetical protein